jgi:DNA-directed RNA polymerase subunit RPC12/RpoP
MSISCRDCGLSDFRPSRFRKEDVPRLLLFQLPVRCTTCQSRAFVPLPEFLALKRARKARLMKIRSGM